MTTTAKVERSPFFQPLILNYLTEYNYLSKGYPKTERTLENIATFKKVVTDFVESESSLRIDGTYRIDKEDGYPAIIFLDDKSKLVAIFKKETNEFVSGWITRDKQYEDLIINGNIT